MQHVETRHGEIAYDARGSGPPLLLLHANGHDHHDFDAVAPALARRFRAIAIDWPGYGASDAPTAIDSASASLYADVLEDVIAAVARGPAVLVGNSIGGTASVRVAARRPDLVRGLVLVSSGGFSAAGAVVRAFCRVQGLVSVRRATGVAFARWYMPTKNDHVRAILERLAASREVPSAVATEAALWRSFARPENDVRSEAARIRCPTLFVFGRHDPVIRARSEQPSAQQCVPHARFAELDTGHAPFAEAPEAFLRVLEPFFDDLRAGEPLEDSRARPMA